MFKVYMYTNVKNNKKYCGITNRTMRERSGKDGFGYIRTVYNRKTRFANAILKYGWDSFVPSIIADNLTEDEAKKLEIEIISKLDLTNVDNGYNMHFGGNRVNPIHCARKGKNNGMYGNGHKLEGSKNGRAKKCEVVFKDGFVKTFNTQKEAREYLNIGKDMFISLKEYDGPFEFSIMTNKSKISKNKHIEGIEVKIL